MVTFSFSTCFLFVKFLLFNMRDQTLSLNFGVKWAVDLVGNLAMQTQVCEVKYLPQFVFPGSLGNSTNMLAFLILSDYWDINRLGARGS